MKPLSLLPRQYLQEVRFLFADIDDTLTADDGAIPANVINALQRLEGAGVDVYLATGRSAGWGQSLARYLPGIRGVVAENGLVLCSRDEEVTVLTDDPLNDLEGLVAQASMVGEAFGLTPTQDDPFRLYERTFIRSSDFDQNSLRDAVNLLDPPYDAIMSSIHVHIRSTKFGKGDGILKILNGNRAGVMVIGDSGNDRPMFRAFHEASVGVANVAKYKDELGTDFPSFVTSQSYADGFLELANTILSAKTSSQDCR